MMLLQRVVGGVGATAVAMGSRAMATLAVRGGGGVAGAMSRAYACRLCSTTTASRLRVQPRQLQQGQRAVPVLHAQTVRWASDTTSSGATSAAADEAFVMPEGLKKFFPEGAAWDEVDVGRRWKTRELRVKSNEDLHKLWYILLIERNKLLTVKLEARRIGEEMPGPLRLKKVKQAMDSIQLVLRERMDARKSAIQTDIDTWAELRRAEGLQPTSTVFRRPAPRPLTAKEAKHLHGVIPPNRSRPGQPERPLKKRERTIFRKQLQRARLAAARKEARAYGKTLAAMTDEQVRKELDNVAMELLEGANLNNLTLNSKACLREARSRGISPL